MLKIILKKICLNFLINYDFVKKRQDPFHRTIKPVNNNKRSGYLVLKEITIRKNRFQEN